MTEQKRSDQSIRTEAVLRYIATKPPLEEMLRVLDTYSQQNDRYYQNNMNSSIPDRKLTLGQWDGKGWA